MRAIKSKTLPIRCSIPNNTCKTLALVLRSSIFPLGLLLILAWSYPVPTCVQSLGKFAAFVLRCSRMLGMSSLHTVLASGMSPYLRFSMMRKFALRSILCAFDISPMEKKQEKPRLRSIRLAENKKGTLVRRLRWKLNRKRTVIRGPRCEIN